MHEALTVASAERDRRTIDAPHGHDDLRSRVVAAGACPHPQAHFGTFATGMTTGYLRRCARRLPGI
jgi:hypothetical protein